MKNNKKTGIEKRLEKIIFVRVISLLTFFIILVSNASAQKQWEVGKFEELPLQMEFDSEAEFNEALFAVNKLYIDYLNREYDNAYFEVNPNLYPSLSSGGMNFKVDVNAFGEITEEEQTLIKKVITTERKIEKKEKEIRDTNKLFKTTNGEYNYLIKELDKLERELEEQEETLGNLLSCDLLGADKDCDGYIALGDLTDYISKWVQGDELIGVENLVEQVKEWVSQPVKIEEPAFAEEEHLIASYNFDNNETPATDSSGNENNGITSNIQSIVSEIKFNALEFNGQDSVVEVLSNAEFNFGTGEFSIALWFKLSNESTTGARHLAGKREATGGNWFRVYYNENEVLFEMTGGENIKTNKEEYIQFINLDEWNFVVATRSANGMARLYLDSEKIAERSIPASVSNNAPFTIGKWNGESSFNGTIDEVRVWRKALSEEEIKELYNSEVPIY